MKGQDANEVINDIVAFCQWRATNSEGTKAAPEIRDLS
jgi:hypothetical protein